MLWLSHGRINKRFSVWMPIWSNSSLRITMFGCQCRPVQPGATLVVRSCLWKCWEVVGVLTDWTMWYHSDSQGRGKTNQSLNCWQAKMYYCPPCFCVFHVIVHKLWSKFLTDLWDIVMTWGDAWIFPAGISFSDCPTPCECATKRNLLKLFGHSSKFRHQNVFCLHRKITTFSFNLFSLKC